MVKPDTLVLPYLVPRILPSHLSQDLESPSLRTLTNQTGKVFPVCKLVMRGSYSASLLYTFFSFYIMSTSLFFCNHENLHLLSKYLCWALF